MNQTMSLKDVAALLGVKAYRIEYLLAHGLVPEPERRISGRRIFSTQDLEVLRTYFSRKKAAAKAAEEKPAAEPVGA